MAYPIGASLSTYLVTGALKNQQIVRKYVSNCFRGSGFPNSEYSKLLQVNDNSFMPTHTLSLRILPPDPMSAPTVNAILKQFRSTMPQFATASIHHVHLLLQGLTSSPIAELRPRSSPSLHLLVALWKQSSLTFESLTVDGRSTICVPPLEIADFVVTDFGHLRMFNFRGESSAATRLYTALLWIELSVPDQGPLLTGFDVTKMPSVNSPHNCGRCGKGLFLTDSDPVHRCSSCSGNPLICATCFSLRPDVTALESYSNEIDACTTAHPFAHQMSKFLREGLVLLSCSCDTKSWS